MAVRKELKERLLQAASKVLCQQPLDAIARTLRPDALVAATTAGSVRPVSRPTAYRAWASRHQAVVDVAQHLARTAILRSDLRLTAAAKSHRQVVHTDAQVDAKRLRAVFRDVIRDSFLQQYRSITAPTGLLLHGAALTSSPLWRGDGPSDSEVAAVGRQVLAARSELYEHMTTTWAGFLRDGLSAYGRRPRYGYSAETIVTMMQSLFEGYVLRTFADPRLNEPTISEHHRIVLLEEAVDVATDAMLQIAWSYTEPDGFEDRRLPRASVQEATEVFERLVTTAAGLYASPGDGPRTEPDQPRPVTPLEAAREAGVSTEAAVILFPTPGDLVDSVLRHLFANEPLWFNRPDVENPAPLIGSVLARLSQVADSHPQAVAAAQKHQPTHPAGATPFLDQLTQSIAHALRSPSIDRPQPVDALDTAKTLVDLALHGSSGWNGVEAILKLLGGYTPTQILIALRRLGYVDQPPSGKDQLRLYKDFAHPEGSVRIEVDFHARYVRREDVKLVRTGTKLGDDKLWSRAIEHDLPVDEYEAHLERYPRRELLVTLTE